MSGMTLIVHGIRIIDQGSLFDHDCDRLVDHRARDSVFEKSFFDRLLSESILETGLVGLTDVKRVCLIRSSLSFGILGLRRFTCEALVEGVDQGGLD